MKKVFFLILPIILVSCDEVNLYDKGYEAAWDGYEEPNDFWTTQEEKKGYQEGLYDVDMYDEGYDDGYEGKKPKYLNDDFYMNGYKNGKQKR